MRGFFAASLSGVLVSASCTFAPEIATLFVGNVIPERSGAHVLDTVPITPVPNVPMIARSDASGATSGWRERTLRRRRPCSAVVVR